MSISHKTLAQMALLKLYGCARRTTLLSTPAGRAVFATAYELYKLTIEAGPIRQLKPFVAPSTFVLDIGANVGFFTRRFARWVSGNGRVIALEPEPKNFEQLVATINRKRLSALVDPIQAAAAEAEGTAFLKLNPDNPADHRLGENGLSVPTVTVDRLMEERGWPSVSLIKIDVQGGEFRVLQGAKRTIARNHPALFIEIDDAHLRLAGCSAEILLRHVVEWGYSAHWLTRSAVSLSVSVESCLESLAGSNSYADLLFLPLLQPVEADR